jgi:hypothetical protein
LHRRVVGHARQLISRNIASAAPGPNDEIAEILPCNKFLFAEISVGKRNRLAVGNAEAERRTAGGGGTGASPVRLPAAFRSARSPDKAARRPRRAGRWRLAECLCASRCTGK